jgi:hypothetical protein
MENEFFALNRSLASTEFINLIKQLVFSKGSRSAPFFY